MIHTENAGILKAIKEIKQMRLSKGLRGLKWCKGRNKGKIIKGEK